MHTTLVHVLVHIYGGYIYMVLKYHVCICFDIQHVLYFSNKKIFSCNIGEQTNAKETQNSKSTHVLM